MIPNAFSSSKSTRHHYDGCSDRAFSSICWVFERYFLPKYPRKIGKNVVARRFYTPPFPKRKTSSLKSNGFCVPMNRSVKTWRRNRNAHSSDIPNGSPYGKLLPELPSEFAQLPTSSGKSAIPTRSFSPIFKNSPKGSDSDGRRIPPLR